MSSGEDCKCAECTCEKLEKANEVKGSAPLYDWQEDMKAQAEAMRLRLQASRKGLTVLCCTPYHR